MTELEKLRQALNPSQLQFVDDYIANYAKVATGEVYVSDIYAKAFPSSKGADGCRTSAWRLLNGTASVRDYVQMALLQTGLTNAPTLRTIDETRADLEKIAVADMTKLMTWKIAEGANGERIPIPQLMDFEEVPAEIRRLIKSVTFTKNGPKLELHDQLKAQDMLNRMNGAYVDKVEMSGPNGGAINVTLSGEVKLEVKNILANL